MDISIDTANALAAWQEARHKLRLHNETRPVYPNFAGLSEAHHRAVAAAYQDAERTYWHGAAALEAAACDAFRAMARTLPPLLDEPREGPRYVLGSRTRYMAVQIKMPGWDAYPAVCAMTINPEGRILARTAWAHDDAIAEATRLNAA